MLQRVITALVGIPFAFVVVFWEGGRPFAIVIAVVAVLGVVEFYGGVRRVGARPVEWAGVLAVILFIISARTYMRQTIGSLFPAVLTSLFILSFCVEFARKERSPVDNVGTTVFGAVYVGWLISHMVVLRGTAGSVSIGPFTAEVGACLVMLTFLCTWACDAGAFFIGGALGKTKIAPHLSPNKTVEGAVGGLVCSLVIAALAGLVIRLPWYHSIALGVLFGVLCQVGDLAESSIKRELAMKDFGQIMPGHGGILDRFDSLLFSGPAAFYYVTLFMQKWINTLL